MPRISRSVPTPAGSLPHRPRSASATCVATSACLSVDAERRLDAVRAIIGDGGGRQRLDRSPDLASFLRGSRGDDGYALRKRLIPLIGLLNGRAGLPKVWSL